MRYSLNEIEQTAIKASRGWGLSWGEAEEMGKAIGCLHKNGIDGCTLLAQLFNDYDGCKISACAGFYQQEQWRPEKEEISPVFLGLAVNDFIGSRQQAQAYQVIYPIVFVALLLSKSSAYDDVIEVSWADTRFTIHQMVLTAVVGEAGLNIALVDSLSIKTMRNPTDEPSPNSQPNCVHDVTHQAWSTLENYAHKTYVEASDQSRMGAGAGIVDSD